MKSTLIWVAATFAAQKVSGHATFQDLWVNGVDEICTAFTFRIHLTNGILTRQSVSVCRLQTRL